MKRKEAERNSSRSNLDVIPLDLKLIRLPAKFSIKTHQKKRRKENKDEKVRKPSKADPIPLDLEFDILTRLPAKSLIKFQCVSKMWSSIIRSQSFVNSYYAMSSMMQSRFIIAFCNGVFAENTDKRLFIFSSSYQGDTCSSLATHLDMTIPSVSLACGNSYFASVHGLIGCTKKLCGPFIVCNPSTEKVTILPCIGERTSLGYDPVGDQFKALTLVSPPYRDHDCLVHEVLTLGGGAKSCNKVTTPPYYPITKPICINGFLYYGARTPTRYEENPVIVCFDVRYEQLSFIKAPTGVMCWGGESILREYKGKLASIVINPCALFHSFDLWILEDVKKHVWSKQTFELPFSLGMGVDMTSPGTNKVGEIIFAPKCLSRHLQPFYIFYYNVQRKDIRRVRLQGIADDEAFRRRYQIAEEYPVYILPEHVQSIASP